MTIRALKASWGAGTATVTHEEELGSIIDRILELGEPTMLFLEAPNGTTLVVGIGAPESVLTFIERDGISFHSVGDRTRRGYLKFRCRDTVDDFHAEMAVPGALAPEAAFEFLKDSALKPKAIIWESDR